MIEIQVAGNRETAVCGDVLCETFRRGRCSKLSFSVAGESAVREGDSATLRVGGVGVFAGIVFARSYESGSVTRVTAYDQLRYLKNRDTYVYTNKRADEVVAMIAADYRLNVGAIARTGYTIPARIEDDVTLADMIENALDIELEHTGKRFVLYDDFGRLSLAEESRLFPEIEPRSGKAAFFSGIDRRCNRVKASRYDRRSGRREIAVVSDPESERRIGILQLYAKNGHGDSPLRERAATLLALRNKDERRVTVRGAVGDSRVRAGGVVRLGGLSRAVVERCLHRFSGNAHTMDLDLDF